MHFLKQKLSLIICSFTVFSFSIPVVGAFQYCEEALYASVPAQKLDDHLGRFNKKLSKAEEVLLFEMYQRVLKRPYKIIKILSLEEETLLNEIEGEKLYTKDDFIFIKDLENLIIKSYYPMALWLATGYWEKRPYGQIEDLHQAALLALIAHAQVYKPNSKFRFLTELQRNAMNEIYQELMDSIPGLKAFSNTEIYHRSTVVIRAYDLLKTKNEDREPSIDDIIEVANVRVDGKQRKEEFTASEVQRILEKKIFIESITGIDMREVFNMDEGSSYIHVKPVEQDIIDMAPTAHYGLDQERLKSLMKSLVQKLKPQQIKVLTLRYGLSGLEPMTLNETGHHMGGLTRERIRQIEAKAFETLRKYIGKDKKEWLEAVE